MSTRSSTLHARHSLSKEDLRLFDQFLAEWGALCDDPSGFKDRIAQEDQRIKRKLDWRHPNRVSSRRTYGSMVLLLRALGIPTKAFLEYANRIGNEGRPDLIAPCEWPSEADRRMNEMLEKMEPQKLSWFFDLVRQMAPWTKGDLIESAMEGAPSSPTEFIWIDEPSLSDNALISDYGVRSSRITSPVTHMDRDRVHLRAFTALLRDFSISPHYILGYRENHTVLSATHEVECVMDYYLTLSPEDKSILLRLASSSDDGATNGGCC